MTRVELPIDQAIREVESAWERRYVRPSPYSFSERNPFGPGHHDCPIDGCDTWRTTEASLAQHLASEHQALDARDVARINREIASERNRNRRRESPEVRARRLREQGSRNRAKYAELRARRAAAGGQEATG